MSIKQSLATVYGRARTDASCRRAFPSPALAWLAFGTWMSSGPLSAEKMNSVFSAMPSSSKFCMRLPTCLSALVTAALLGEQTPEHT